MAESDPARGRFAVLQLVRLAGLGVVLLGALFYVGRLGNAPELGAMLLIAGAAAFFFLPRLLARRWKSPDQ